MSADPWTTHSLAVDRDPEAALQREWLLTNGTGAFAAGTVGGCPTRRYHGLLVGATQPPAGRRLVLNQLWEQLTLHPAGPDHRDHEHEQRLEFTSLLFRDDQGRHILAPRGIDMLQQFDRGLSVRWVYAWGKIGFERELFLHFQQQAATVRYRVSGLEASGLCARLRIQPMLSLRDFHALLHRGDGGPFRFEARQSHHLIVRHEDQAAAFNCPHSRFEPNEHWWYRIHYPIEAERGQDCEEDLFVPGLFDVDLNEHTPNPRTEVLFTVALGEQPVEPSPSTKDRAAHLEKLHAPEPAKPLTKLIGGQTAVGANLRIAADDFVVERRLGEQRLSTIIAGYPWFGDWGRDTFIALPGLLLCTGRCEEARKVLRAFAGSIRNGLVPNRFDDYHAEAAHYNTVDASLWFIQAAIAYVDRSGDVEAWRDWLGEACLSIVEHYQAGTGGDLPGAEPGRALIRMDEDGLIEAGTFATQLTWMDAACGDVVFTPRPGKAVEINALWHSALCQLAERVGGTPWAERGPELDRLARQVRRAFNAAFWNEKRGWLIDHLWRDGEGRAHPDRSLRPNQAFAVSLPFSPLAQARQKKVVKALGEHLLTPVGLRTLPPSDPAYHGRYQGDQFRRDEAYHQGTIWPWLLGPYAEAVLRAGRFGPKARRDAAAAIAPLLQRMLGQPVETAQPSRPAATDSPHLPAVPRGALGQLHEIYEADPDHTGQHRPAGCPAQAWSVAEVIRIIHLLENE